MNEARTARMGFRITKTEVSGAACRGVHEIPKGARILHVPDGVTLADHVAAIKRGEVEARYSAWPFEER